MVTHEAQPEEESLLANDTFHKCDEAGIWRRFGEQHLEVFEYEMVVEVLEVSERVGVEDGEYGHPPPSRK